jgi:CTD nuclear envelope phosphatase 1
MRGLSSNSSSSGMSSESESDRDRSMNDGEKLDSSSSSSRHTRSKSLQGSDEIAPARRSIRIKLHNEDSLRQRKHRKAQSTNTQSNGSGAIAITTGEISPATLKSPTSPAASMLMTKYPRAPAPPRPLIPRRQPSYTLPDAPSARLTQKTLILDLDETLIHSMAKGGRMSTGHMVEVKLSTLVGAGGGPTLGPQHPILYYVHKRPHCDDFLRRVSIFTPNVNDPDELQICKWYNLVIFTASVQEYADPVIDWLEQERKFFSGRYYRQHCTFRHGAFIKDLSSVEPDLSKVMILDNSPLSYMFHQGKYNIHGQPSRTNCCKTMQYR